MLQKKKSSHNNRLKTATKISKSTKRLLFVFGLISVTDQAKTILIQTFKDEGQRTRETEINSISYVHYTIVPTPPYFLMEYMPLIRYSLEGTSSRL